MLHQAAINNPILYQLTSRKNEATFLVANEANFYTNFAKIKKYHKIADFFGKLCEAFMKPKHFALFCPLIKTHSKLKVIKLKYSLILHYKAAARNIIFLKSIIGSLAFFNH